MYIQIMVIMYLALTTVLNANVNKSFCFLCTFRTTFSLHFLSRSTFFTKCMSTWCKHDLACFFLTSEANFWKFRIARSRRNVAVSLILTGKPNLALYFISEIRSYSDSSVSEQNVVESQMVALVALLLLSGISRQT